MQRGGVREQEKRMNRFGMEERVYQHKVQYYETDKMGVVHHSNYIRWFEECRVFIMEQEGLGYDRMEEEGILCPVLSVSCEYKSMTAFGETVEIIPKVEKFNGARLVLSYQVKEAASGEIRCTGESSHCFLDEAGHLVNLRKKSPAFYEMFSRLIQAGRNE